MSTAVKTVKRDYAQVSSCPDAATVLRQLDCWFEHYNTVHPHKAPGYRSPMKRSAGPARWPPIAPVRRIYAAPASHVDATSRNFETVSAA